MRVVTRMLASLTALALVLLGALGAASATPRPHASATHPQAQSTHSAPVTSTAAAKPAHRGLSWHVSGVGSDGGAYTGGFTLKKLQKSKGKLTASGTLRIVYTAPGKAAVYVKQKVRKVPVTLTEGPAGVLPSVGVANAGLSTTASTAAIVPAQLPLGCELLTTSCAQSPAYSIPGLRSSRCSTSCWGSSIRSLVG